MLLAIIQVYNYLGATDFALLSVSEINLESQKILWLKALLQQQGADLQIIKNYIPPFPLRVGESRKRLPLQLRSSIASPKARFASLGASLV